MSAAMTPRAPASANVNAVSLPRPAAAWMAKSASAGLLSGRCTLIYPSNEGNLADGHLPSHEYQEYVLSSWLSLVTSSGTRAHTKSPGVGSRKGKDENECERLGNGEEKMGNEGSWFGDTTAARLSHGCHMISR